MKALSIKQPWAWLITQGKKDIENRTWQTAYRGPFLVHASKKVDMAAYKELSKKIDLPPVEDLWTGGIVGQAELTDCVKESGSPWFYGPVGFVLENARPLPFRACLGKLSFFEV